MFCQYNLLKEVQGNPDFIDLDEVKQYLTDEEIDTDELASRICSNVNDAVDMVLERAWEKFNDSIDNWHDSGDYCDHDYPSCIDGRQFAQLVVRQVRLRVKQSWCDRG